MKSVKWVISILVLFTVFSASAHAESTPAKTAAGTNHYHLHIYDASGDEMKKVFEKGFSHGKHKSKEGFKFFPAVEIGSGSGALTASLGVSVGYKYGWFFAGTALRGQVVNIDHVNYQFMPATLNIMGLSYSVIPETTNNQNDKTLKGQSIGIAMGGKLSFSQMIETDPVTNTEREYLVISVGAGF